MLISKQSLLFVTPCVGVWIEIVSVISSIPTLVVTPCVGVWIEMSCTGTRQRAGTSLPAWECGLKYYQKVSLELSDQSLPAWECGLKCIHVKKAERLRRVTPCVGVWIEMAMANEYLYGAYGSLPAWECGLK